MPEFEIIHKQHYCKINRRIHRSVVIIIMSVWGQFKETHDVNIRLIQKVVPPPLSPIGEFNLLNTAQPPSDKLLKELPITIHSLVWVFLMFPKKQRIQLLYNRTKTGSICMRLFRYF